MMRGRIWFFVVILLGCGLLAVWLAQDEKLSEAQLARKKQNTQLFAFTDANQVMSLHIASSDNNILLVRVDANHWQMQLPLHTDADFGVVDSVLTAFFNSSLQARVGGKGKLDDFSDKVSTPRLKHADDKGGLVADLSLFELDKPHYTVTLRDANQRTSVLKVGKRNSFDGMLYVLTEHSSDIGMIDSAILYQLSLPVYDFRDKRAAEFEEEEIVGLTLHRQGHLQYQIARNPNQPGFVLEKPFQAIADQGQVSDILGALANLRGTEFLAEKGASPSTQETLGVLHPQYDVKLVHQNGNQIAMRIGLADSNVWTVTTDPQQKPIMSISADWLLKKLKLDANQLEDKASLALDTTQVFDIAITQGSRSLHLQRASNVAEQSAWHINDNPQLTANPQKVEQFLQQLSALKAETVLAREQRPEDLAQHGFQNPNMLWQLVLRSQEHQELVGLQATQRKSDYLIYTKQKKRLESIPLSKITSWSVDPNDFVTTDSNRKP